ncbi:MAG: hypothetical protein DWQ47_10870 [Acidobacteria bacterium]|nr:MAG: hypothetical protein DWQ32_13285 [Acidobacteriota bacterium]REJ98085.1 MAG: hypothetical protein DWQ38_16085 [Acidobacteriota bacterium]REK16828.1 MAG: hypothetical protein DWQ43_01130 [Acidobacteriota bacterium]REK42739.1 MAG: hypothetical protein DWQ47_10870 [Acidobacteriota bacterium]
MAFAVSAALVLASIPVSASVRLPDLPGITLVLSGAVASLIALRRSVSRTISLLAALVVLTVLNLALHRLMHHFGSAHEWLDPFYLAVVAVYCLLAFGVFARSIIRIRS